MVEPVTAAVAGGIVVLTVIAVLYGAYLKGRVDKSNEWDVVSFNDIMQYRAIQSTVDEDDDTSSDTFE